MLLLIKNFLTIDNFWIVSAASIFIDIVKFN